MDPPPAVVFVAAFDRSAHGAFEGHAVDCLTEPARPERLAQTVERLKDACP
jgi:two-component system LytT family response regulator